MGEQTRGERLVEERVRACLAPPGDGASGAPGAGPPGADGTSGAAAPAPRPLVFANVRWIAPSRPGGPPRDGEIDLLVVDPARGILAVEVKDGPVRLDGFGRWYAGTRELPESPFRQAENGKHAIAEHVAAHPDWIGPKPRMLHAVAFPDTDRASLLRAGRTDLGPDAPLDLVIDRADLADPEATRRALDRVFTHWAGDGSRDRALSEHGLAVIHDVIEPRVTLGPSLAGDLAAGEHEILVPTHHQLKVLTTLRGERRASIVGAAGSGKTLIAVEKARQLASIGFNVLLACFNAPLARALADDPGLAPHVGTGRVTVGTFHELCRRLASEAGTLPPQPARPGRDWFESVLPRALADAIPRIGGRWQALVVDEGQDFDGDWLTTLLLLLSDPDEDVVYVFHDPAQALYRADACAVLGLREFPLPDNCRNARPIHDLAFRWYAGEVEAEPLREDGRAPRVVAAEPGEPALDALRDILDDLVKREGIERERIAVLTGVSLEHSAAWQRRRFRGDLVLWNGHVDDEGRSLGLPFDAEPAQPPRTIAIETIHRFKGLERDVAVLVELRPDDERLGCLLYIGATRAKHHLVVIAPPELAARLAGGTG
jgi:hypothetical protein